MTGDTRLQTVDSIAGQGVAVLIKPFSADELLEALSGREKRITPVSGSTPETIPSTSR
jgi:hypothetical protein